MDHLNENDIQTFIHYPRPVNRENAFSKFDFCQYKAIVSLDRANANVPRNDTKALSSSPGNEQRLGVI